MRCALCSRASVCGASAQCASCEDKRVCTSTDGPGVVDESRDERNRGVVDHHGRVEHNSHDVARTVKVRVELHGLALVCRLALEVGPERQRTRNT